jgi:hypothetical protein
MTTNRKASGYRMNNNETFLKDSKASLKVKTNLRGGRIVNKITF